MPPYQARNEWADAEAALATVFRLAEGAASVWGTVKNSDLGNENEGAGKSWKEGRLPWFISEFIKTDDHPRRAIRGAFTLVEIMIVVSVGWAGHGVLTSVARSQTAGIHFSIQIGQSASCTTRTQGG